MKCVEQDKLDLYFQDDNRNNKCVIVVVHGGAWVAGSKQCMKEICEDMVNEIGCICISVGYSLSMLGTTVLMRLLCVQMSFLASMALLSKSKTTRMILTLFIIFTIFVSVRFLLISKTKTHFRHPSHVIDVCESIKWVVDNISAYNGDKDKICLLGYSAGGHIVSLIGLNDIYLRSVGLKRDVIKGVVSISGPYSHARLMENPIIARLLDHCVFCDHNTENMMFIKDAWPITSIDPSSEINPPFLLLSAEIDGPLLDHVFDMFYALFDAGIYVKQVTVANTTHFTIKSMWTSKNHVVLDHICEFINEIDLLLK